MTAFKSNLYGHDAVFNMIRESYNDLPHLFITGPPGCGKTTFIKTLASHFRRNLAYLTLNKDMDDTDLKKCIQNIPKNSFFCLEDIDSFFVENSRRPDNNSLTFSGFINILDGISTPEDTIIFMTTNNLTGLEHAIIRRINYFVKFTYATREQIQQMFVKFFPNYSDDFDKFWNNISDIPITINILEKFFVKYLFDNIIEKSKLFPNFANGESNGGNQTNFQLTCLNHKWGAKRKLADRKTTEGAFNQIGHA